MVDVLKPGSEDCIVTRLQIFMSLAFGMQGYVSSRRRRQRRIAELVTLVEQLEQYLTILRSESSNLQNDIQSLGTTPAWLTLTIEVESLDHD